MPTYNAHKTIRQAIAPIAIKIYIVLSSISYQELSFNSIAGPDIYTEELTEQKLFLEQLKSQIKEVKCYLIDDVDNGDLFRGMVIDLEAWKTYNSANSISNALCGEGTAPQ